MIERRAVLGLQETWVPAMRPLLPFLLLCACEQSVVIGRGHVQGRPDGGSGEGRELGFSLAGAQESGGAPAALLAADPDQDGRADVVLADGAAGRLLLLRGTGGGRLRSPETVPTGAGPASLAAADLDRDGRLDLLSSDADGGTVSVHLSAGGGALRPCIAYAAGARPAALAAVDLDGDGWSDAVAADAGGDAARVLLNRADGTGALSSLAAVPTGGREPMALALGRLAGRAHPDVLLANRRSADVSLLRGEGRGALQPMGRYHFDVDMRAIALLDLTGDGILDLAGASSSGGLVVVLPGAGDSFLNEKFAERRTTGAGAAALVTADLDGDGLLDLACATRAVPA